MINERRDLALLLLTLPLLCSAPSESRAQDALRGDWNSQREKISKWSESIKSIKCHFSLSTYTNAKYRTAKAQQWKQALKENPQVVPFPNDANSSVLNFWVADSRRWRNDKSRFFPRTGLDFSQYLYNGEKYFFFDDYLGRAVINAQPTEQGFIKGLKSNQWLGLAWNDMLDSYAAAGLGELKVVGQEEVAGRKCTTYKASNAKGSITVSVDNEYQLLVRLDEVFRPRENYASLLNYEWKEVKKYNGILLPTSAKLETYDEDQGTLVWGQTVLFSLKDCEVNIPIGSGYFENVLRIGTELEDNIENPGTITYVGNDLSTEAASVRLGNPPGKEISR